MGLRPHPVRMVGSSGSRMLGKQWLRRGVQKAMGRRRLPGSAAVTGRGDEGPDDKWN